jgi:hypothetical protein
VKKTAKGKILILMLTLVLCCLGTAGAETGTATGNGALSASARLNFQITIPKFIIFTVGTAGAAIDTVQFDPTPTDVASATANLGATGGTGNLAVSIISNGGQVTLQEANNGGGNGLSDGGTNYISYAQINTADSAGSITPPTLSDAGGNSQTVTPSAGVVTIRNDTWTYTYDNPATPPAPGTYTGQVTYTAAVP